MTRKARSKPSTQPQTISNTAWYYEHPKHLEFIVECRDKNGYHRTLNVTVPIKMLKASLARIEVAA